jgi:hypothetical protein
MPLTTLAWALADRAAVVDIEVCDYEIMADGTRCYDLCGLVNADLLSPESLALNADSLRWAFWRGLIEQHPTRRHLVRLKPATQPAPHIQPLQFRS